MSRSKRKSSSDIAGTAKKCQELEAQRKDEERQEEEEVTEDAGNGKGIFFIWGGTVSFEAQDPNVEWYTKVAAAVQNATQCYHVIYEEKKRATTQMSLDHFFKRGDRTESSKEPEPVPSASGVTEIEACPLSPIVDDPSALPSPTSPPSLLSSAVYVFLFPSSCFFPLSLHLS